MKIVREEMQTDASYWRRMRMRVVIVNACGAVMQQRDETA
jgi:hypothetical protein